MPNFLLSLNVPNIFAVYVILKLFLNFISATLPQNQRNMLTVLKKAKMEQNIKSFIDSAKLMS